MTTPKKRGGKQTKKRPWRRLIRTMTVGRIALVLTFVGVLGTVLYQCRIATLTEENTRARVTIVAPKLLSLPTRGRPLPTLQFIMTNVGKAAATSLQVVVVTHEALDLPVGPMPADLVSAFAVYRMRPGSRQGGDPPTTSLEPGELITNIFGFGDTPPLAPIEMDNLNTGVSRLFYIGRITYETLGTHHDAEFCFRVSPWGTDRLINCDKWNESH